MVVGQDQLVTGALADGVWQGLISTVVFLVLLGVIVGFVYAMSETAQVVGTRNENFLAWCVASNHDAQWCIGRDKK